MPLDAPVDAKPPAHEPPQRDDEDGWDQTLSQVPRPGGTAARDKKGRETRGRVEEEGGFSQKGGRSLSVKSSSRARALVSFDPWVRGDVQETAP